VGPRFNLHERAGPPKANASRLFPCQPEVITSAFAVYQDLAKFRDYTRNAPRHLI
jgi:hypothetical protein